MSIIDRFTSTHERLTETNSDDQQNSDRVLNPETRRALGRELRATGRLWAVVLIFVPFVYASAFLWTLGLSIQLFVVLFALDMLAGIAASMYVAIRLNLILRPRGESQALADADSDSAEAEIEAQHEAMEGGPEASRGAGDTAPSEDEDGIHPVGESDSSPDETDVPTGEEASSQQATESDKRDAESAGEDQVDSTSDPPQCPDCEESDRWSADGHNGNLVCDNCGYMPEKQVRDEIRRKRGAQGENTADEQAETQSTDDTTDTSSERVIS